VVGHRLAAEAEPLGDLVVVVAGGDRGDGPGDLLLFGALEDVASGAGAHGGVDGVVVEKDAASGTAA
jgi:hypothetical protein